MQTPIIIATLIMGSVVAVLAALRAAQEKRKVPSLANVLGQGEPVDMRQAKLSRPWSERVMRPMLRKLYRMGRYLTPSRNIEQLQHNLIVAGLPGGLTVTDFLGLRFLMGAVFCVLAVVLMATSQPMGLFGCRFPRRALRAQLLAAQ
jgi:hypothetical protein